MRKVTTFLFFLILLNGFSALAQTQIPLNEPIDRFRRYVGAGVSAPTGLLEQFGRRGFHFWGRVGYSVTANTELTFGPDYHTFDRDNRGQFGTYGGRFYTLMLGMDLKYNLGNDRELRNPYIFVGMGWAFMEVLPLTTLQTGTRRSETAESVYLEGGAGIELDWVFLQAKVVRIPKRYVGDKLTHFPISIGLKF